MSREERWRLLRQQPLTVWLTGLSGAGKSSIAGALERRLVEAGRPCYLLDGDVLRAGINSDLGFGPEDRRENIRRSAEIARLINEAGLVAIAAFISPYGADRAMARQIVGSARFVEVYVDAPLAVCEARDPKGLYRRARRGEVRDFTGVSAPYEAPPAPDLALATDRRSLDHCVEELFALVARRLVLV